MAAGLDFSSDGSGELGSDPHSPWMYHRCVQGFTMNPAPRPRGGDCVRRTATQKPIGNQAIIAQVVGTTPSSGV